MPESSFNHAVEAMMKNPWMSAWLSAANGLMAPARDQMLDEMQKTQRMMMLHWQKAWIDAWMGMWTAAPGSSHKK